MKGFCSGRAICFFSIKYKYQIFQQSVINKFNEEIYK